MVTGARGATEGTALGGLALQLGGSALRKADAPSGSVELRIAIALRMAATLVP